MKIYLLITLLNVKRVLLYKPLELEELLNNGYDKLSPPKRSENEAVNVTVSLFVIQIRSIDETEMDFKMDFVIREMWQDHRLNFPQIVNKNKVILDPKWREAIWTPDIWFKNALDIKLHEWVMPNVFFWLEEGQTVCFSGRVTLELSCDMDMHKYPHDIQDCGVSIMALMNPSTDLKLRWKESDAIRVSRLMHLPQFEVGNTTLSPCNTLMYEEMFSCIRASFQLIRRSSYYIINIYIPTILIVLMSMLTFWIPPEAVPARITLGVTSLLTIITKQYQSNMPNVSYVIALNIWLSSCVAFVFCSLLEYAIVITLIKKKNTKIKPANINENSDEIRRIRNSLQVAWKQKNCKVLEKVTADIIDVLSRILFPLSFCLFCIIYNSKYG